MFTKWKIIRLQIPLTLLRCAKSSSSFSQYFQKSLKSMWNTAVGIKNCEQPFSLRLAFATEKKTTPTAVMMSVLCVAIFWVVKASSCKKSCLQFSIPTGFGVGGEGGVSHRLKARWNTFGMSLLLRRERHRSYLSCTLLHWEGVSHCLKAMCHTDVEAPMVTNWFPYFLPTSLFFGSKRSKLLFSYLLPTITCFAFSRKTYWFGEIRETDSLPWELQRRYATLP